MQWCSNGADIQRYNLPTYMSITFNKIFVVDNEKQPMYLSSWIPSKFSWIVRGLYCWNINFGSLGQFFPSWKDECTIKIRSYYHDHHDNQILAKRGGSGPKRSLMPTPPHWNCENHYFTSSGQPSAASANSLHWVNEITLCPKGSLTWLTMPTIVFDNQNYDNGQWSPLNMCRVQSLQRGGSQGGWRGFSWWEGSTRDRRSTPLAWLCSPPEEIIMRRIDQR